MKKLKIYYISVAVVLLLVISFLVGFFLKPAIKRLDFIEFFDSNFFVAVVTLFVGGSAIFLYWKQRDDNKRDMARLILQEIRYAEDKIRQARLVGGGNFPFSIKLLPTNNWNKNVHLFINELKDQSDLISNFYSQAAYLDELICMISNEKGRIFQIPRKHIEKTQKLDGTIEDEVKVDLDVIFPSGYRYEVKHGQEYPDRVNAQATLQLVANSVEFIYNSSAVDKLRDIAEGKI